MRNSFSVIFFGLSLIFYALFLGAVVYDGLHYLNSGTFRMATLGELVFMLDPALLNLTQAVVERYLSVSLWDSVLMPLLLQPAVLLLFAFGFVFHGISHLLGKRKSVFAGPRR